MVNRASYSEHRRWFRRILQATISYGLLVPGLVLCLACGAGADPTPEVASVPAEDANHEESEAGPGESGAGTESAESVVQDEEDPAMAESDAGGTLMLGEPTTLRLDLPENLRQVVRGLGAEDSPTLRLTLDGLENPGAQVSVRVFVNHPEAGTETSIGDPRYLGDVGFYPTGDYGSETQATSFLLDAGEVLARLPAGERLIDDGVEITLIAVAQEGAAAQPRTNLRISFEGARLSVHASDEP